jgi:site-specific recombinase XerD
MEKCASNWGKIFSRVFNAAGVEGHPYQFRHIFAKRLFVKGVSVGFVASLLGHRKVGITEKFYSKWISERQAVVNTAVTRAWTA